MSDQDGIGVEEILSFGAFELFRGPRVLARGGKRVRIGGRALDILIALAERAGEVVTKRELMAVAWPHTFVDESNLRVHIAALRKLLGEGPPGHQHIVNVAGRGYLFAATITRAQQASEPPPEPPSPSPAHPPDIATKLVGISKLIGRDAVIAEVIAQIPRRRMITVVGPAGVGKSAVAAALSEAAGQSGRHLTFVDLSAMSEPALLPAALAAALGVSVATHDPMSNLIAFLADQQMLVILDNCEHIVDAVTALIETLLRAAPEVRFLATSREPLLASAEWVYRLRPLEAPAASPVLDAGTALKYPAVQLFVERAASSSENFEFTDGDASDVAEICLRLDGLPLAIELIATRVDLFGIRALATDLGERLALGGHSNRTATSRQHSIRAALDWSYDLLSPSEKLVLSRISVFRGPFSWESAVELIPDTLVTIDEVLDALSLLTAKSLLSIEASGGKDLYRLLHITRAYAEERLVESGEALSLERRHAGHFRELLSAAEARWETMTRSDWLGVYGHAIDDVRSALAWAFSPRGDLEIGASILTASLPFGYQLSLIGEFKERAEKALPILNRSNAPIAELRLVTALTQFALSATVDPAMLQALFERIDLLSKHIEEPKYKTEALLGRIIFDIENGDYKGAVENVSELGERAREADDPLAILATDRIAAQALHFAGNQRHARSLAERVIRHPAKVIPLVYSQTPIDRQVTMRIVLARAHWIEGNADQAARITTQTMDLAYKDGPLPTTFALAMMACPITLWAGDDIIARRYVDELLSYSRRHALERWGRLGEGYNLILNRREAVARGTDPHALDPVSPMHRMFLATLDPQMVDPDLTARAEQGLCGWCNPEILRIAGEHSLRRVDPGAEVSAERFFQSAIADARKQGALSWELRAATSLAELRRGQARSAEAHAALVQTMNRFAEGTKTRDFVRASSLLEALANTD